RARRRSSAGSLISGSFWMSWRYWSNAPDGLARKNALGLTPLERAIEGLPRCTGEVCGYRRADNSRRAGLTDQVNIGNNLASVQISLVIPITNRFSTGACAFCPLSPWAVDNCLRQPCAQVGIVWGRC